MVNTTTFHTFHGVFLELYDKGVLLTGSAGIGKSDCALQLLSRGHRLIADDCVHFCLSKNQKIVGSCEKLFQGLLEIRSLGIVDIRQIYGDKALLLEKTLDLIIHFTDKIHNGSEERPLKFSLKETVILNKPIPSLTLSLAFTKNTAILVEAAVRLAFAPLNPTIERFMACELKACD